MNFSKLTTRLKKAVIVTLMITFVFGQMVSSAALKPAYAAHAGNATLQNNPTIFTEHYDGLMFALRENWVAAFMMMTEFFTSLMMYQMLIVATFLDAEQQLEVQTLYRSLAAQAHKEYHPSFQMCEFGTMVRSLASADIRRHENARIITQLYDERDFGNYGSSASAGNFTDYIARLDQFKRMYCDVHENNDMSVFCYNTSGPAERRFKDVDYTSNIDLPYTITGLNYTDAVHTPQEEDLIALGRNLFGHRPFDFVAEQLFFEDDDDERAMRGQNLFMETRSVHAIRSVARRSFANIVAMKAQGEEGQAYEATPYLQSIVEQLGVPVGEINDFLGPNPSYYAQMEVLTRMMYQRPEFYTNLYDKPDNVRRTGVALQAFELMQNRDRFEASLRREMLVSMMVELKLREYQEKINRELVRTVARTFSDPDY